MDITFTCNSCGQLIEIEEAGAGLSVQCPACSSHLIVPAGTPPPERPIDTNPNTATGAGELADYEVGDNGSVTFKELDLLCQCSRSPNGRYLLASRDAWELGEEGDGLFFLLEERRILCRGELQRPHDGKVANNGNFIVNDWMFFDPELVRGIFYAFNCGGEVLIRKRFKANLYSNGISNDGCFAVCQTCSPDSLLYLFDLTQKKLLSRFKPLDVIAGYADRYRFDTENLVLYLSYTLYLYTVEIECRFDGTVLAVTTVESSEMGAREAGSEHYEALTLKTLAQIYLEIGEKRKAISHLEAALQLDPKIGGKRLFDQLKRELGKEP